MELTCEARDRRRLWAAGAIALVVLVIDFLTKAWVHQHLPLMHTHEAFPYGGLPVFKNLFGVEFSISHLTNRGAAWGTLGDYQVPLVAVRIVLILGMIAYLAFFNKRASWTFPLALITAGAIGNVVDYFLYGHVVDMFHFILWGYDFPVFNVADAAVSLGIFWIILFAA